MPGNRGPRPGPPGASPAAPPESTVAEALARLLESRVFRDAPILSRLLRHLVEHALRGERDRLKEYAIGLDVFDRRESFDPRMDTIVRVQARRLRARLEDYYKSDGRTDPVVIDVPRGHYVAVFRWAANPAAVGSRTAVPASRTRLIGRRKELAAIGRLLGRARLLTLTGAGGSGKTRLAVEAVTRRANDWPGGIHFGPLASINDPGSVPSALAQCLGLRHTGGKPLLEALLDHVRLSFRSRTLLFLDNFEHLLPAAPVVSGLLEACPALQVLVTSREALRVYGEVEYPVPPLAVPDPSRPVPLDALSRIPAVALFLERVSAVRPGFALEPGTAPAVAGICARLDGLPLAIELAAARVKMLLPEAVLDRLGRRLEFLVGGARDLPARQQALRSTIDWSHDLLGPSEQKLFRRLSVFAGGFTLEAAEAVGDTRRDLGSAAADVVASLVDKSLLHRVEGSPTEACVSMLETTREYGQFKLAESGETGLARQAHAAYFLVLAEEGRECLSPDDRTAWLSRCDREQDNFRAALDYLCETGRADWARRLGVGLFPYWEGRERVVEGHERLEAIRQLEIDDRSELQALITSYAGDLLNRSRGDSEGSSRLFEESLGIYRELGDRRGIASQLNALGVNDRFVGNNASAQRWFEESLSICRDLGDGPEIAAALSNLAAVVSAQGDHLRARTLLAEARTAFREAGDETGLAWSVDHCGDVARDAGSFDEARRLYREAVAAFRRIGDRWGQARGFSDLASLACAQGDHRTARSSYREALALFRELGHSTGIASVLEGLAASSARAGDPRRASLLAGAAAGIRYRQGARSRPVEQAQLDRVLREAWDGRDPRAAEAAWSLGWRLPLEEAIERALTGARSRPGTRSTRS